MRNPSDMHAYEAVQIDCNSSKSVAFKCLLAFGIVGVQVSMRINVAVIPYLL